ncbi:MAG: PhnD/SsuA/transferrin family substrate-binding protein [Phyllobacteriaceae bacterium]|nr:PhnD/SsuA/transferrin family substrate-binding protein [Phyllobacteriaceae bacterium]
MSRFIAALPMYDWPELRAEVDAEWADLLDRLRARGIDAPQALTRRNADMTAVPGGIRDASGTIIAPDPATLPPDEFDFAVLWRHPSLLLAQTCWGPMETTGLAAHVRVVGQPDYSAFEGGEGELYRSALVMRNEGPRPGELADRLPPPLTPPLEGEGDYRSGFPSPSSGGVRGGGGLPANIARLRFACNDRHSMSGYLALARDLVAAGEIDDEKSYTSFWTELVETGAHRASVVAVAEGRADVAAIDCRTWAYCLAFEPAAKTLAVAGWTAPRKGLPFITSRESPLSSL